MTRSVTLHRLRSAVCGLALAVVLTVVLSVVTATFSHSPGGGATVPAARAEERRAAPESSLIQETVLIDLVNTDRITNGLAPLEFDPNLATIARWRSEDMAARGYFSHDIGGYQVFQVLRDHGISYRVAGENLAYNYYSPEETAARAEAALMDSPPHRANILREDYTHVGVGVAQAPDGRYLFTQLFKKAW